MATTSYEQRRLMRRQLLQVRDTSSLDFPENWLLQAVLGRIASSTGLTVTPLRMMGIATTFACIRVLSKTMASLPLQLFKGDGQGGRILAMDHPLYSICHDAPNQEMTAFTFLSTMEGHLSLRQNAYAEILRDVDGDPVGLYPMDPNEVRLTRVLGKLVYTYIPNSSKFTTHDVLHLVGYSRNALVGIDHSYNLQEVFALAIALQDNAAKFFGNGSRPVGVLEHPASLSAEAQMRLRDQLEQSTSGKNAYRMMVLEEGLKYQATRSENKDSQFQEAREYQDLQICRVFGVPPHKAGITHSQPRANVEEENLSFVADVIRPECVLWESALNMKLLNEEERGQGYHFEFQMDALLCGALPTRYAAYAVGRTGGWLSVNDVRRMERMNPVKDGDGRMQPLNYGPLGALPPVSGKVGADGKPVAAPQPAAPENDGDEGDLPAPVIPALLTKPKEITAPGDTQVTTI